MARGASEDRLAHNVDLLEADTGVPRDCLPAAMDDRVGWRKRAMEGGGGGRGERGSTEVDLVVVVELQCGGPETPSMEEPWEIPAVLATAQVKTLLKRKQKSAWRLK